MLETRVWSLGWEDPLEKEMATQSSIPAWRTPWAEEPDGLQSTGCKESDTTEQLTHTQSNIAYVSIPVPSSSPSSSPGIHTFVLFVCVSISALQINPSDGSFLTDKRWQEWWEVASENRWQKHAELSGESFSVIESPLGILLLGEATTYIERLLEWAWGHTLRPLSSTFPSVSTRLPPGARGKQQNPTCIPDSQKLCNKERLWFQDARF